MSPFPQLRAAAAMTVLLVLAACPSPPPGPGSDLSGAPADAAAPDLSGAEDLSAAIDLSSPAADLQGGARDLAGVADLRAADLAVSAPVLRELGGTPDNLWVVGDQGYTARWDGAAWTPVASGTTVDLLHVYSSGRGFALALGKGGLVLRWNGAAWSVVPGTGGAELCCVSGTGPTDAWIAGARGAALSPQMGGGYELTFWHWDGAGLTAAAGRLQGVQRGGTPGLASIVGVSPTEYYAGGGSGVVVLARYLGAAWSVSQEVSSSSNISGIFGAGPGDVWITRSEAPFANLKGSIRSVVTRADRPTYAAMNTFLLNVHGSGAADIWAYGQPQGQPAYDLHFDGAAWSVIKPATLLVPFFVEKPGRFWHISGRTVMRRDGAGAWAVIATL